MKAIIILSLPLLLFACNNEPPVDPEKSKAIAFEYHAHDVSEIVAMDNGVYTTFSSSNPNTFPDRLRQYILDLNTEQPAWRYDGHWPVGVDQEGFDWHTSWMSEYDYDPSVQVEHTEITAVAPSALDANTVYFHLYNNPGRAWAVTNNTEPAMFAGLYRATASGTYPNQQWNMEPTPVYYSDDTTFMRGGPRAVDANVWKDHDNQLYMTFGSWDPESKNVIVIAEMDETTGRIKGFDMDTPGYYPAGGLDVFHTVATFGEAAFSFHHGDYYYLFLNLGGCCSGVNSTYYIVAGRSTSIFGPYVDKQGKAFNEVYPNADYPGEIVLSGLLGEGTYIGPGHSGIIEIDGRFCLSFHYYDGDDEGTPKLGTRTITFDNEGWPVVTLQQEFEFK